MTLPSILYIASVSTGEGGGVGREDPADGCREPWRDSLPSQVNRIRETVLYRTVHMK